MFKYHPAKGVSRKLNALWQWRVNYFKTVTLKEKIYWA
jgi:hypothetical protein